MIRREFGLPDHASEPLVEMGQDPVVHDVAEHERGSASHLAKREQTFEESSLQPHDIVVQAHVHSIVFAGVLIKRTDPMIGFDGVVRNLQLQASNPRVFGWERPQVGEVFIVHGVQPQVPTIERLALGLEMIQEDLDVPLPTCGSDDDALTRAFSD
jgi:hypothetical protein